MIGHKKSLNKYKKIEIISTIFSDNNGLKLETNLLGKTQKESNSWKLNNMLLMDEWVNNEIKEEIKKFLETNENEHTTIQNPWDTVNVILRGKFIPIQSSLQKIETFQIISPNLHLQELEEQQTMPRVNRTKEVIVISEELNDTETKGIIQRVDKSRSWIFEKINKTEKPLTRLTKKKMRDDPNK